MYAKIINRFRTTIPFFMIFCGGGLVICVKLRCETAAMIFGMAIVASVITAFGLAVEYLVRAWLGRSGREMAWYQFSLGGLMVLTTFAAVLCGFAKIFGVGIIVHLAVVTVILACIVEGVMLSRKESPHPFIANIANQRKIVSLTPNAIELARNTIRDRAYPPETALRVLIRDNSNHPIKIEYDLPCDDDRDWFDASAGIVVLVSKAIANQLEGLKIDAQDGQYTFTR
jgi:hypothetical protein